jgi:hypothetical protein
VAYRGKAIEMLRRIEKRRLELLANQARTEITISTAEPLGGQMANEYLTPL